MGSLSPGPNAFHCKHRTLGFLRGQKLRGISSTDGLRCSTQIVSSLRNKGKPRKPLWRGRIMTTEAIQVVQALKRVNKDNGDRFEDVLSTRVSRLVKADLLATLAELQRQNECELALKVFDLVREEVWYKPDLLLYADMLLMLGRNKLVDEAEWLFAKLGEEGLEPDTRTYTELLAVYTTVGMIQNAMDIYEVMKRRSGCNPNELTFTILINCLERSGERDLANVLRKQSVKYLESMQFLEDHAKKTVAP